ncbi:hypothetical protein [Colidextribacter sp. OB.20]|jgi:cell division protein FtsB|uniref:hypothetical protein n=1 Tax=Colidextribacter sp. OB.20 TaxID=2304568 RepID=UPI00136CF4F1|nr:hypothetical protein [Colidextribacter sp. OB.20]
MVKRREDSIKEMNKRKSNEQLTRENEELRAKVAALEEQVDNTNLALCDVYEQMIGGME